MVKDDHPLPHGSTGVLNNAEVGTLYSLMQAAAAASLFVGARLYEWQPAAPFVAICVVGALVAAVVGSPQPSTRKSSKRVPASLPFQSRSKIIMELRQLSSSVPPSRGILRDAHCYNCFVILRDRKRFQNSRNDEP